MRKIAILVGAVALLTLSLAPAAFAANFQCTSNPCYGTNRGDTIFERGGSVGDRIYGLRGDDSIYATLFAGDTDFVAGNRGDDDLHVNDGDFRDEAVGGPGLDVCYGDWNTETGAHDTLRCEVKIWTYYP